MSRIAVIGIAGNSVFLPVERFHVGGETVEAKSVHFEPGGKGFNQAVSAARYGAEVAFLGAVGADGYDGIKKYLESDGIKAYLPLKQGCSAFAAIVTDANGINHVTVHQGVDLTPADVDAFADEITSADILLLNNEVPENVNIRAIEIAKANGVKVVLNPAPARESAAYILDNVDLFTPNEHETLGIEDKSNMIVTLGSKGCLLKELGEVVPAISAGKVVDTTGAGDTFNGVLVAMLADGADLKTAALKANTASGIGVTRKYAASSIPTKAEIDAM